MTLVHRPIIYQWRDADGNEREGTIREVIIKDYMIRVEEKDNPKMIELVLSERGLETVWDKWQERSFEYIEDEEMNVLSQVIE